MFPEDRRRLLTCQSQPLVAKYPLVSNLTDTVNGYSATHTRSTTKWYPVDTGGITVAGNNTPAYMGTSGILLEPGTTDYGLHGDFDTGWSYLHTSSVTRVTDPMGGTSALHCVGDSATDAIDVGKQVSASGFSGDTYFSLYMKSSTNWVKIYQEANGANYFSVCVNLSTKVVGTYSQTGSNLSATDFTITDGQNGFTRVQFKMTNNITTTSYQDFYTVSGDNSSISGAVGTTLTVWELDCNTKLMHSIIETPDGTNRTVSPDVLSLPVTKWRAGNYSMYFEWTPLVLLSSNTLYYEHTDANNELKLVYGSGTWTLTSKASGVTKTVSVTHTPVIGTQYKIYYKVGTSGLYLNISGTSNSAAGQSNGFRGTAPYLNYTDGVSVIRNFKFIRGTKLTLAEAEVL